MDNTGQTHVDHSLDPLQLFREVHALARSAADPAADAGCLGTVGTDGIPNARFIELKEVSADGFVFGTHLASRKANELAANPGASLTFWWVSVQRQVRI